MLRLLPVLFLLIVFLPAVAFSNEATHRCEILKEPFRQLANLTLDPSVENPPKINLCHRIANAKHHFAKGRIDKAASELEKYISSVESSAGNRIASSTAGSLVMEAERLIAVITGTDEPLTGTIAGLVSSFSSGVSLSKADVVINFPSSGQVYTTITNDAGMFSVGSLPVEGAFIVSATAPTGEVGTAQGALLPAEPAASISVKVDFIGSGIVRGKMENNEGDAISRALVTVIFPDTSRVYTDVSDDSGSFSLTGVHPDGTAIIIGFESETGASGAISSVLLPSNPLLDVALTLQSPNVINSNLLNGSFSDGLEGWITDGSVQVVDRELVFGSN